MKPPERTHSEPGDPVAVAHQILGLSLQGMSPYLEELSQLGVDRLRAVRRQVYGNTKPRSQAMNMIIFHLGEIVRRLDFLALETEEAGRAGR